MHIRVTLTILLFFTISANLFAVELPTTEGNDVINYLNKSNYQNWQLWPGKTRHYKNSTRHGTFLTTYVSKDAYNAIEKKKDKIPNGGFIVMESYSQDMSLLNVNVMYKESGYSPGTGDWFWLKYVPGDTINTEGKATDCIDCHAVKRNNDWLYTGPLK
jgi:hypothetical protein